MSPITKSRKHADAILERHRARLSREAGYVIIAHPELLLAGLIMESGAAEPTGLRQLCDVLGETVDGYVGVVPHVLVATLLRSSATTSHAVDELLLMGNPSLRILLVAVVTTSGCFVGTVAYRIHAAGPILQWQ